MSRIGKMPVTLGKGVEAKVDGRTVTVKGPKGTMSRSFPRTVEVKMEDGQLVVERNGESKAAHAMHGTARSLLANMVKGVSEGYRIQLVIEGTGYRAEQQGKNLLLNVGFSHPVLFEPPEGVSFEVPKSAKEIVIQGADKEAVGEIAAKIRGTRPPEPYKGKGIRYSNEKIRRKAGKAGKAK